ncbi:Leucine-zipper-like transcriptional regulator 1, partial [Haplosporangium bisporale]
MPPGGFSLLTIVLYLFSFADNTSIANAQYVPESTRGSVSAFVDGKAMYVQGGLTNLNQTTAQSFSLDLSNSWDVAAPAYNKLPDGVKSAYNPGALLNDSTTLFIMSDSSYYYYNVLNGQLTGFNVGSGSRLNATLSTNQAATNSRTGRVYIPYGEKGYFDSVYSLLRFDPDKRDFDSLKMPANFPILNEFSVAWSDYLDTMLFFGGADYKTLQTVSSLYRYNYGDGSWTLLPTTGEGPSSRSGACLTPVAGGRRMVVFGGESTQNITLNDIYVLDVETWKWTRGPDAPPEDARAGCSCSVSNDMLVAWGGYFRTPYFNNNPKLVAVYSMTSNTWVDKFTYTPLPKGSGAGSNLGAIIGGSVAGFLLLCGIFYAIRRKRKAKVAKPKDGTSQHGTSHPTNPKPLAHSTPTSMTARIQQQPSYAHVQAVPSMPVVFTPPPPPLLPRPPVAPPPASVLMPNYYQQQPQQAPYQIPIVTPTVPVPVPVHTQQQLYQQYEQRHQEQQQAQQKQKELEQNRVKQAKLEEELVHARQIEGHMIRLQSWKDQAPATVVSRVPDDCSPRGPQDGTPYPVAPPVKSERESYATPLSTVIMSGGS